MLRCYSGPGRPASAWSPLAGGGGPPRSAAVVTVTIAAELAAYGHGASCGALVYVRLPPEASVTVSPGGALGREEVVTLGVTPR